MVWYLARLAAFGALNVAGVWRSEKRWWTAVQPIACFLSADTALPSGILGASSIRAAYETGAELFSAADGGARRLFANSGALGRPPSLTSVLGIGTHYENITRQNQWEG